VSSLLGAVILFSLASLLLVLPLLPAIFELRRKTDAEPLRVIQQYAGEIRHFAGGFRKCIDGLQQPLQECMVQGTTATGKLREGDEYLLLGRADDVAFEVAGTAKGTTCPLVVAAGVDLALPSGLTFLKEIYAGGQFLGGEETTYRAILGDKNVHLQRASRVMRWAHAAGSFQVDHDCDLYGRISSDIEILLQPGCIFQRLNAPRIAMGCAEAVIEESRCAVSDSDANEHIPEQSRRRRLIEGDWKIQPGEVVAENIVTRGSLRIGAGAKILGSVKSNGELIVEASVIVEGSLIGSATMHIGPRCQIGGPVIAEHEMRIQASSQCGTAQKPTTVSAPLIEVEEGSLFCGTLWAREQGRVVPRQ
jgi:cytoskeletal protein CcmA (bactofilin family)